jgi:hypothetical protein
MDVLVAIGITAAWGFSALVVLLPEAFPETDTFFDDSLISSSSASGSCRARARTAGDALKSLSRRPD